MLKMKISDYCVKHVKNHCGDFYLFMIKYTGGDIELPVPVLHKFKGFFYKNLRRAERRRVHYESQYTQESGAFSAFVLNDLLENGSTEEIAEHFGVDIEKALLIKKKYDTYKGPIK